MYNADEFEKSVPPGVERSLEDLPYDVARKELYVARELFDTFDPAVPASVETCLDTRVGRHLDETGRIRTSPFELQARTMHDAHIRAALYRMLEWYEEKKVVGIMGGHALLRTDDYYRRVVEVSKVLTERGFLMISGGGPGAMEATHVGAWLAGRPQADVESALEMLGTAPSLADARWLSSAFEVMKAFPQEKGFISVSIPTWHFSSEPPTPFATYIAKFFENSLREDVLLSEAYGGLIFMPGGAGTLQEIFQEIVQNHYVTLGYPSPMVFVGRTFWTETIPVYPLIEHLVAAGRLKHIEASLVETTAEIVAALDRLGGVTM